MPVTSIALEQATDHFGFLRAFFALACPVTSALTQMLFGWHPMQRGLLSDLRQGNYFDMQPPEVTN